MKAFTQKIYALAKVTAIEIIRSYVFFGIIAFFIIVLLVSKLLMAYSPGSEAALMKDIGLMMMSSILAFTVIVIVAWMIPAELRKKTIYMILANPISRQGFIIGKFLGVFWVLFLCVVLMTMILEGFIYAHFGSFDLSVAGAALLIFFANLILLAITIMASTFLSSFVNMMFVLTVYLTGSFYHYVEHLAMRSFEPGAGQAAVETFIKIIPNLEQYYVRSSIVVGLPVEWGSVIKEGATYSIIYSIIALFFGCFFFRRKEV